MSLTNTYEFTVTPKTLRHSEVVQLAHFWARQYWGSTRYKLTAVEVVDHQATVRTQAIQVAG